MYSIFILLFATVAVTQVGALDLEAYQSIRWVPDTAHEDHVHSFIVSLGLRNRDKLISDFHDTSNPKHSSYGKFLSQEEIRERYSPEETDVLRVSAYLQKIVGSKVTLNAKRDMITVSAKASAIEQFFDTSLMWHKHHTDGSEKRSLRATSKLHNVPAEISELISFISLNSPINHMVPHGYSEKLRREEAFQSQSVTAQAGNQEALIRFAPVCGDGLLNTENPPCAGQTPDNIPRYTVSVQQLSDDGSFYLNTNPSVFELVQQYIFCYNNNTLAACAGAAESGFCTCLAKISPLPMYTMMQANVTSTLPSGEVTALGVTSSFTLTDVATVSFLSNLYNIPPGLKVANTAATQGVAEFYGEFYSNSDLAEFLSLSGLPNAEIPVANVLYGYNNQSDPGGEAQLDVEYLMGLAPGSPTYFYSVSALNPYDPENEGFLTWLNVVADESNPPLVQSLSYGDVEADVFQINNASAYDYGTRCDEEFMQMGLRGISVLVSSGDDGLAGSYIRDNVTLGCSQAWPAWPASSPYITSIGATQLTNLYLPGCGQPYNSGLNGVPPETELLFQCTGTRETVCSAATGGVITTGGGFSDVYDRATYAPWQVQAVDGYLAQTNAYPSSMNYFNVQGRAYPDVATYGSNYFVYLKGKIMRESGTSASAPVFAAMVTLWNDIRLTYGMAPMGFIAPFLYDLWATNPEAFNDVVTGNNACGVAGANMHCCDESFAAAPGWDAVSGLGTPNFGIIANAVINPNSAFPSISSFPDGSTSQSSSSDSSDDKDYQIVAIAALVVAVLSMGMAGYAMWKLNQFTGKSSSNIEKNPFLVSEQ